MNTPEERASRLKQLRNLANLSRDELCQITDININTLIGWEVARHGGLSQKGAKKIIEAIEKKGIYCSLGWLMEGKGTEPYSIKLNQNVNTQKNEKSNALKELDFFKQLHPSNIHFIVNDNGMLPEYEQNDIVAATLTYSDSFENFIGKTCIIIDYDNNFYLRKLRKGNTPNTYHLICSNNEFETPIMYNVKIKYLAPVKWHRKID